MGDVVAVVLSLAVAALGVLLVWLLVVGRAAIRRFTSCLTAAYVLSLAAVLAGWSQPAQEAAAVAAAVCYAAALALGRRALVEADRRSPPVEAG